MPRLAPWSYFTRSLRECLANLSKVMGTSSFFIVTMQDGFFTMVRLHTRADMDGNELSALRISDLAGLEVMHSTQSLVMSDTARHPKGAMLAEHQISAYMGVPIVLSDGTLYGTLCTADQKPYDFTKTELHAFEMASTLVAYIIDLERTAVHDPLTGALNRLFLQRYTDGLHREFGESFALVYIDLDGFKDINDQYGHESGDAVLRVIVQRLKRRIRMEDVVIRVGGDEFIVILTDISSDENVVNNTVGRLHRSLDVEYAIGQQKFRVSASLGVSRYPHHGTDFESLIQSADKAMYEVKRAGGKGYFLYGGTRSLGAVSESVEEFE